ncbi:ABC transporter ATP-binding protein [Patescibacteria group bacterium]|nr:MAG: ABC transporter ATP-binding protein [Patescibacteria group bacterium]
MSLIDIHDLRKDYVSGDQLTPVLKGVDLVIEKGEFVAIMGPSGSGKSTLMHILGFLDTLTDGSYHFNGIDVSRLSDAELAHMRRTQVGFVFQAFFLLPKMTVLENVMLPLGYDSLSATERHTKAVAAVEAVGLSHRRDYPAVKLSGGEKQRVAIARAFVADPQVLFADEPTGNLDSKSGAQVMALLDELHRAGRTIIVVTHETATAEHAERIIRIRDGQILSDEKVTNRRRAADDNGELGK